MGVNKTGDASLRTVFYFIFVVPGKSLPLSLLATDSKDCPYIPVCHCLSCLWIVPLTTLSFVHGAVPLRTVTLTVFYVQGAIPLRTVPFIVSMSRELFLFAAEVSLQRKRVGGSCSFL